MSLVDIVTEWSTIQEQDISDNIKMGMSAALIAAGCLHGSEEVKIDVIQDFETDMLPRLRNECTVTRDLDSACGLSRTTPYNSAMEVFVVAPKSWVLTADNHLAFEIVCVLS